MADIDAISRGIAALLRDVYPAGEGHVSHTFQEAPTPPTLQIVGVERMVPDGSFADEYDWTFVIEAYLGLVTDRGAHAKLNELLSDSGVPSAVESDIDGDGCLYSRLQDDGTVLANQQAAASDIQFVEYRGPLRVDRGGQGALTGTFVVRVLA